MSTSRQERPYQVPVADAKPAHECPKAASPCLFPRCNCVIHQAPRTWEVPVGQRPDEPKVYAERDASCKEWVERIYGNGTERDKLVAEMAFVAGWSARKAAQYVVSIGDPKINLPS